MYNHLVKRRMVLNFQDERSRWAITPDALDRIKAALTHDWELVQINAPVSSRGDGSGVSDQALDAIKGAEVYAGFGFPRELFLAAGPKLRWVHTGTAGVASMLYQEMVSSDVAFTNSAGVHAPPMAETVIAMMLYFARGFDFAVRNQLRNAWDQSAFETTASPIVELAGRTVGILGYGGIGRDVARRAKALGMHVLATRRSNGNADEFAQVVSADGPGLEQVLRASDVVVIALPATAETRGMIGIKELSWLKPDAVLINVARGNIIVETALIDALKAGRLRGAGLDVFEHEPLDAQSPLWQLDNVLLLPHVSATTPRFWEREAELIAENLGRYQRGQELLNTVDKTAGY
jgi:D-2-hydroxyacid dehydrogenase (NADP+)